MPIRDRTQNVSIVLPGSSTWIGPGSLSGSFSGAYRSSQCVDVVDGTRGDHPMMITHSSNLMYQVYGLSRNPPSNRWDYNGHTVLGAAVPVPLAGELTDNTALSSGLARTNPNRPKVDVLQFGFELKDLPRMLKNAWDFVFAPTTKGNPSSSLRQTAKHSVRSLAKKNLEWEFGWSPLISDLQKLLEFQKHVDKKLNMLRRLRERGSMGGKATVQEDTASSGPFNRYATSLYQENNRFDFKWETTREKWVTCRWTPTVALPPATDGRDENLAWRLAFGLDISPAVIWELMPWSWLIDWFSNVGDLASLSRNTIPVSHSNSCIMTHTQTRLILVGKTAGTGSPSIAIPARPQLETKKRSVMGSMVPLPEFNLPFLNGKQLGILASLAITRTVR